MCCHRFYKNRRGDLISDGIRGCTRHRGTCSWTEWYYHYRSLDQRKRSVYIPKRLLRKVLIMDINEVSVESIIGFIKGFKKDT